MKPLRYRLWVCLLFALLLTAVFGAGALADGEGTCGDDLAWKVENETLTISGTGDMPDFEIDASVQKPYLWYTMPGTTAPWDRQEFKRLVIEEGVTSIGKNAFNCHTELLTISLPDSLKSIGESAFEYCENLTDFIFPDAVEKIGQSAFSDCRGLRSLILPESLTNIEYGIFRCCNGLKKIILPGKLKSLADSAFYACGALEEVSLPASLVEIAAGAFSSCERLQNLVVVKDSYAEKFCALYNLPYTYAPEPAASGNKCGDQLEWVLEDGTLTIAGTGKMDDYMRLMGGNEKTTAPWDGLEITQAVLEPGVTSVGAFAFWGCEQLKTVILPDTVTEIGKLAFEGCILLRDITLPESVAEIGRKAFSKCRNLKTISLPDAVSSIGDDAFDGCGRLENVTVEPGSYAEQYCAENSLPYSSRETAPGTTPEPVSAENNACGKNLTWTLEENGTLRISGSGAMNNYEQTREEPDQDGKARFGSTAPWSGSTITRVVIEDGVTSVGTYAFESCAMTEISLPGTLVSIGQSAFEHCENLAVVTVPDSVTEIGMFAFNECTGLVEIRLPASLKSIGAAAFQTCMKLAEITLPEGVENVGMYVFHNCIALKTVTLPASLQALGEFAFDGCQALKAVIVPKDSYAEQYCIQRGIEYVFTGSSPEAIPTESPLGMCGKNLTWKLDDDGTLTVSGFGNMDDYEEVSTEPDKYGSMYFLNTTAPWYGRKIYRVVVEEGVERIGSYAFYGCEMLQSIKLPGTLTAVGSYAFGRTRLVDVDLPDSLTSIGTDLFYDCRFLESVQLPAGLKLIPVSMFCDCEILRKIVLPETVQRIDGYAFSYCRNLKEINLPAAVFDIGSKAFEDCTSLKNVIVAKGSYAEEYCLGQGFPYTYTDGTKPEKSGSVYAEGRCGADLTWKLVDGTLTISGTGKMDNYTNKMTGNALIGVTSPWDGKQVDTIIVEEGVTSIGDRAFAYLRKATTVSLPDTLVSIGDEALLDMGITEIYIPDSVKTLGSCALDGNCFLTKVKLPASLDCIEFGLFQNCSMLSEVTIPDTAKSIGSHAFARCTSINEIRIPDSVIRVDEYAFEYCPDLRFVVGRNSAAEAYCIRNSLKYSYAENE